MTPGVRRARVRKESSSDSDGRRIEDEDENENEGNSARGKRIMSMPNTVRLACSPPVSADTRAKLGALRAKGLDGTLRQRDLREFRKKSRPESDPLRSFLSQLRALRRRGERLKDMPAEAIAKMEGVIEVIENAIAGRKAGDALDKAA